MSDEPSLLSEFILYQAEDGRTHIQCRFEDETLWLSQIQIAELFQKDVRTINEHLSNLFAEGELSREATIRKFRIVRQEGSRRVSREVEHYKLSAILAVGYRVRSHRGTQFRQWATERLGEYLLKGFTMDDERLKNPPGPGQTDYFDEQQHRDTPLRQRCNTHQPRATPWVRCAARSISHERARPAGHHLLTQHDTATNVAGILGT